MPPTSLFTLTASAATRMASAAIATSLAVETLSNATNENASPESKSKLKPVSLSQRLTQKTCATKSNLLPLPAPFARRSTISSCENLPFNDEQIRFQTSLEYHLQLLSSYKQQWDYVENRTSRVPTIQWPAYPTALPFPDTMRIKTLIPEVQHCRSSPNYQNDDSYCHAIQFQIAYLLITQQQELSSSDDEDSDKSVPYGWQILQELAERGHADSMCLYAQIFNNGHSLIPLEANPQRSVAWWHHCHSLHPKHSQTIYELGVAYYTGEGTAEDESLAVKYFTQAAKLGHAGAAYMLGDCLLEGVGVQRDRSKALEWLVKSGQWGHRGARSRVLAVLDKEDGVDYGGFTDASRQTLVETPYKTEDQVLIDTAEKSSITISSNDIIINEIAEEEEETDMEEDMEFEEEEELQHWAQVRRNVLLNERRFTVAGPSSVSVLQKRKTKVMESREESIPDVPNKKAI